MMKSSLMSIFHALIHIHTHNTHKHTHTHPYTQLHKTYPTWLDRQTLKQEDKHTHEYQRAHKSWGYSIVENSIALVS